MAAVGSIHPLRGAEPLTYTKESYAKKLKSVVLHHLIALQQKMESCQKVIDKYSLEILNFRDSKNHSLSPLALAVIFNRKDVASALLKKGGDLSLQDQWGFTPLHHAVLLNDGGKMLRLLLSKVDEVARARLQGIRDEFGGTYEDLRALVSPEPIPPDQIVCRYRDEQGRIVPLTAAQFLEKTGAAFSPWFRASPKAIFDSHLHPKNWEGEEEKEGSFGEIDSDHLLLMREPGCGFGVEAARAIKKEERIGFYIGDIAEASEKEEYFRSIYGMREIQATHFRNLLPCVNHGPPNCAGTAIRNYRGVPRVSFLKALRAIHPGEAIHYDYGAGHALMGSPYTITPEAFSLCSDFFRGRSFLDLFSTSAKKKDSYIFSMVEYALSSIAVFVKLHLRSVLSIPATLRFLQSVVFRVLKATNHFLFADYYEAILKKLQPLKKDEASVVFIEKLFERFSQRAVVCVLLGLPDGLKIIPTPLQKSCETFASLLDDIYLFVNGTLYGSYLGTKEEQTRLSQEEPSWNRNSCLERFQMLPQPMQSVLLGDLETILEREPNHPRRAQILDLQTSFRALAR